MPWPLWLYNFFSFVVFLLGLPFFLWYSRRQGSGGGLSERLGFYPVEIWKETVTSRTGPIWLHAVSVGEIKAAVSLARTIRRFSPDIPILLSTTTPAGRETAEKLIGDEIIVFYFPLDFYGSVKRALSFFQPRIFVALETELWPNFIYRAHRLGTKILMVNGRISNRSFARYLRIRWLLKPLLRSFHSFAMIHQEDARHIVALGADPEKVQVFGNIKYDDLLDQTCTALEPGMARLLNIPERAPVLVAGSTREGEEALLLNAYNQLKADYPDLILILAPRHLKRISGLEALLRERGLPYQLLSRMVSQEIPRREPIVLVDRIGDLFALYSLATLTFCGASLVPKGGQNILEAAAWGKVVLYGPHMDDFIDAQDLLEEAEAGVMVRDLNDLVDQVRYFLDHPEERARRGEAGRQALRARDQVSQRAARKVIEAIG